MIRPIAAVFLLALAFGSSSCSSLVHSVVPPHQAFRTTPGWEEETFVDEALLAQTNPDNSSMVIILGEQRAVMLKDGRDIVVDTPVATGRSGHATPVGNYTILQKKQDYRSNLYGSIVDANGDTVNSDADARTDAVPPGGRFVGASMPYWQRLTNTGIGMHVGHVPVGSPASHGCIRFPRANMPMIWERTRLGTPVAVVSSRDFGYPVSAPGAAAGDERKKPAGASPRGGGARQGVDEAEDRAAGEAERPRRSGLRGLFGGGSPSEGPGDEPADGGDGEEGEDDSEPVFRPR